MKKMILAALFLLATAAARADSEDSFLSIDDNYWLDVTGSWVVSDVALKVLPEDLKPLGPAVVFAGDFVYEDIHNPSEGRYWADLGLDALGCGLSYVINIKW
ncbi:MAG TPA: hypothetical protein VK859_05410 [bacterium]|jgi:hypothetical protein|nr:hypothetical protein [bacterium]